jgi:hypothetical protein
MPSANLPSLAPHPPYVRLEVCEELPDGEIRVHLGLDLRLPLNLADSEALALRMAGELARNAHAAAFLGSQFAGANGPGGGGGDGVPGATGGPAVTVNAGSGAGGGGRGK